MKAVDAVSGEVPFEDVPVDAVDDGTFGGRVLSDLANPAVPNVDLLRPR